jgi:hypothetical protein
MALNGVKFLCVHFSRNSMDFFMQHKSVQALASVMRVTGHIMWSGSEVPFPFIMDLVKLPVLCI